jgi:DNA-binding response OmpR family regulator
MMPNMDGFTLAQKIKSKNDHLPFLFLTAKSLKADKLKGFALGAEDYITKPFDEEELLCRLQVIMRRQQALQAEEELPTQFSIGNYSFDCSRQELKFEQEIYRLTEKESEVLRLLCLNKNQILRRDEAVEQIYGKRDYFLGRSFDVFISKLRKLLKQDEKISIDNVFRVGFILNVEE